ncbi:MAG: SMP-30/gluconolactonase/LRE family protein [Armatimonadetes bacterium]|nr:SMP-30/gluconolactonase/LRE family protein [Armatimonadota bacterium]
MQMQWTGITIAGIILLLLLPIRVRAGQAALEARSPDFWNLVSRDAALEKVAEGFQFTEGPVWHPKGYLLFSDIPANRIYKWKPGGKAEVFREPSDNSNGLTLDRQGRLLACEHSNRRVSRTERGGKLTVRASEFEGKRLNSPNDIVVKSDGSLYFTDPPYGIRAQEQVLPFQGIYRLSPRGKLTLLVKDFDRPNGLALSPDEKTLYIADSSERSHIRAFDVKPDGTLANGRLLTDLKGLEPGVPDGMKVDARGNIFSTGPGGVWVIAPDGRTLGIIRVPEVAANCAWGEADGKTLYITASTGLYRIRLRTAGIKP